MQTEPDGLLREKQILGRYLPISRAAWWKRVREGRFPKPLKLGPNTTVWRVRDILDLIEKLNVAANEVGAEKRSVLAAHSPANEKRELNVPTSPERGPVLATESAAKDSRLGVRGRRAQRLTTRQSER
jgi:predicted DNA-binding transcriptional regulator AlpA